LTRLSAREEFVQFCRREIVKTFTILVHKFRTLHETGRFITACTSA
jgi:hypothetical protein